MLEMATGYLPVNQNWERYIHQSNAVYEDMERETKQLLMRLANDACEKANDER
jgi:DNA polymerase gamma 1